MKKHTWRRKFFSILALALALGLMACAAAEGVEVVANPDSKTGYTATFTYVDDDAQSVQLRGGFNFYKANDIYVLSGEAVGAESGTIPEDSIYTPETWEPGMAHINDSGYTVDMAKGEDGVWTVSLDLPSASYLYQYIVTDAEGNEAEVTDPPTSPLSTPWALRRRVASSSCPTTPRSRPKATTGPSSCPSRTRAPAARWNGWKSRVWPSKAATRTCSR